MYVVFVCALILIDHTLWGGSKFELKLCRQTNIGCLLIGSHTKCVYPDICFIPKYENKHTIALFSLIAPKAKTKVF